MEIWIALLRGINVGGHNKLPMAEFRTVLTDLGCKHVSTYVQSGNAVFTYRPTSKTELSLQVRAAIERQYDFSPEVMLLEREALQTAIAANPFMEAETDPKSLHLFFLESAADPSNSGIIMQRLNNLRTPSESIHLDGDVLFLHTPDGIGKSKLARGAEKALGTAATARNWRTVTNLAEMANQTAVRYR